MAECYECENRIAFEDECEIIKSVIVPPSRPLFDQISDLFPPVPQLKVVTFHQKCFVKSTTRHQILELAKRDLMIQFFIDHAKDENLTWRRTVELLAVYLLNENQKLKEMFYSPGSKEKCRNYG